jgi:hypothetical protein
VIVLNSQKAALMSSSLGSVFELAVLSTMNCTFLETN